MYKFIISFLFLIALAAGRSETLFQKIFPKFIPSEKVKLNNNNNTDSYFYDILIIRQMWPQTACWNMNHVWKNSTNKCSPCNMPEKKHQWTLHGLWPSNTRGKHPSFCNDEIKFNPTLLSKNLTAQLEEKWPSFKLHTANEDFWKHEWDKHGSCALNLPSTNTVTNYFTKATQLLDQYNVGRILAEAGIFPGKSYDWKDLIRVIQKTLGVKITIDCAKHSVSRISHVNEIEVCLNKSFELIDCPDDITDCVGKVSYPEPRQECKRIT